MAHFFFVEYFFQQGFSQNKVSVVLNIPFVISIPKSLETDEIVKQLETPD
jgi:hypothetical protein